LEMVPVEGETPWQEAQMLFQGAMMLILTLQRIICRV
jgi:hypothetical protein